MNEHTHEWCMNILHKLVILQSYIYNKIIVHLIAPDPIHRRAMPLNPRPTHHHAAHWRHWKHWRPHPRIGRWGKTSSISSDVRTKWRSWLWWSAKLFEVTPHWSKDRAIKFAFKSAHISLIQVMACAYPGDFMFPAAVYEWAPLINHSIHFLKYATFNLRGGIRLERKLSWWSHPSKIARNRFMAHGSLIIPHDILA